MPDEWSYGANAQVPLFLDDIIDGADQGMIALPDFQRDFDWTPTRVVSLLTSVARQWPIGSLLIIQADRVKSLGWGARPLMGAPENTDDASILVLDGQQRLTSLYHALRDTSDDVYYCEIGRIADEDGEVDDDRIRSMRRNRYVRSYRDEQAEAGQGIIKLSRLFSDREFRRWLNHVPEDQKDKMEDMRLGPLGGLRSGKYAVPATRLEGEVPPSVVAKIFETMNRGALLLSAFDLMVARLWPRRFYLRDKWEEAKLAASPYFDEMDGLEALQVIALRERLAGVQRVKGIRQSDVLEIDPGAVEQNWDRAIAALGRAVRFLAEYCGAIRWNLIPAHTMLIPLADALWDGEVRGEKAAQLRRWFWASTVHQTYAQGANTQAVADAGELRAWFMSPNALPECVQLDIPDSLRESLADTRRRNQMLTRGVLSLLISRDARDWIMNTRLRDASDTERIDIHHVFPATYLKDRNIDGNVVANVTPLLGSTNRSLRSDPPSTVVARASVRSSSIASHRVPLETYRSDDWDGFVRGRVEMLTEAFREELDS